MVATHAQSPPSTKSEFWNSPPFNSLFSSFLLSQDGWTWSLSVEEFGMVDKLDWHLLHFELIYRLELSVLVSADGKLKVPFNLKLSESVTTGLSLPELKLWNFRCNDEILSQVSWTDRIKSPNIASMHSRLSLSPSKIPINFAYRTECCFCVCLHLTVVRGFLLKNPLCLLLAAHKVCHSKCSVEC